VSLRLARRVERPAHDALTLGPGACGGAVYRSSSDLMKLFSIRRTALLVSASVALFGSPVAADGVARRTAVAQSARVGREFKIKAGRAVTLRGENLRLRFAPVVNDSRCPTGVECVWAGNAEVLIEVGAGGRGAGSTLRLNTNTSPERAGEGKYRRYTVRLVGLSPYPRAGRKIRPGEYTATLLVSKE
jgi:hypothetical protein